MRTIKFRAWDKKEKKMRFGAGRLMALAIEERIKELKNHIVMQFTGLKDKNDKEIYEGDIVVGDEGFVSKVKGVVKYEGLAFSFQGHKEKKDFDGSTDWFYTITSNLTRARQVEVIGNIYENPELLEVTKSQ